MKTHKIRRPRASVVSCKALTKRYKREQKRKVEEEQRTGYYTIPDMDVVP